MKYLLLFLVLFIGTCSFAHENFSSDVHQKNKSTVTSHYDVGKNKKSRRGKRANKKRKRRCHRAARRNFAG